MEYIIFCIFLGILLYDYKKGVVIYAPFKFFFYEGFRLGPITFDIAMSVIVFFMFIPRLHRFSLNNYPWKKSLFVLLTGGIIFSCYPYFYMGEFLRQVFCICAYSYIFFCVLDSKEVQTCFIKAIVVFALLLAGNGIVQLLTDNNYIGDFHESFYKGEIYDNSLIRYGDFSRVRSFCSHSISYGVECAVLCFVFLFLYINRLYISSKLATFMIILTLLGVIASGSRSPLIGFAVFSTPFILSIRSFSNRQKLFILCGGLIVFFFFGSYIELMLQSIIDSDNSEIGGSTIEGRLAQFSYSWELIKDNLIFGYGCIDIMHRQEFDYSILYGAESIWMVTMLQRGIVGLIIYIYFYFDYYKAAKISKMSLPYHFFLLGWLIIDSITSLMGINMFLPIMILTFLYKTCVMYAPETINYEK